MSLHPAITVGKSSISGRGLISRAFIPRGTIVWTFSPEQVRSYTPQQYRKFSPRYRRTLRKYAYTDYAGNIIYTLGDARFFNHSCAPNTTDALCEELAVALRDIAPGDEITYDYGLLMGSWEPALKCACGSSVCRKKIGPILHSSKIFKSLMRQAVKALRSYRSVAQPMLRQKKQALFVQKALAAALSSSSKRSD